MDNVVMKTGKFMFLISNDNFLRLFCFGFVGISLLYVMFMLGIRGVRWVDKEGGKVRGHTFAFAASYLFIWFLFLGFIFDFIASAWVKMGDWILYGYAIIMTLFTGTNVMKTYAESGVKKAELASKMAASIVTEEP